MFIKNKLFLGLLGISFLISQYHGRRASKKTITLDEIIEKKGDIIPKLKIELKRVNTRFSAINCLSSFVDCFFASVSSLNSNMVNFYGDFIPSRGSIQNLPRELLKEKTNLEKQYKVLQSKMTAFLRDKSKALQMMERTKTSFMLIESSISNSDSSLKDIQKDISNWNTESERHLDRYTNNTKEFFNLMSQFRNESIKFGQELINFLSDSKSTDAITIIQQRFYQSNIKKDEFDKQFRTVKSSLDQIQTSIKNMKGSIDPKFSESFVNFANEIFPFQESDYIQLKASINSYNLSNDILTKISLLFNIARNTIKFNYLYQLSEHVISVFTATQEMINATQEENPNANYNQVNGVANGTFNMDGGNGNE